MTNLFPSSSKCKKAHDADEYPLTSPNAYGYSVRGGPPEIILAGIECGSTLLSQAGNVGESPTDVFFLG